MSKRIPKVIYQSWKTKELPQKMREMVEITKKLNPNYKYELWDDNDCRKFLLENFGENYLNAFDTLIPGAFKCDFWRYAILYKNGGIYMDIDMIPEISFDEMLQEDDQFVSIVDRKNGFCPDASIYQAFIACTPFHPIMLYSLQLSFNNIVTRKHDFFCSLTITGPAVVGRAVNLYWKKENTFEKIKPGNYSNGLRLFQMNGKKTSNSLGEKLFNNKFDGYKRGSNDYGKVNSYYKNDPNVKFRQVLKYIFFGLLFLILIFIFTTIIYVMKFKKCKQTCSFV